MSAKALTPQTEAVPWEGNAELVGIVCTISSVTRKSRTFFGP